MITTVWFVGYSPRTLSPGGVTLDLFVRRLHLRCQGGSSRVRSIERCLARGMACRWRHNPS
jgi:hypothetical protein